MHLGIQWLQRIVGATKNTGLPTYIFHVQVLQEYTFPTRRILVGGLSWTDLLALTQHVKRVASRRGEDKKAVYYPPEAFRPIATFADELNDKRYVEPATRLAANPVHAIE